MYRSTPLFKPVVALELWMLCILLAAIAAVSGCTTPPAPGVDVAAVTGSSSPTFNEMATPAVRSVTATRMALTALLDAGKISTARAIDARLRLDAFVDGIKAARALQPSDPAAAQRQLDALKKQADALNVEISK